MLTVIAEKENITDEEILINDKSDCNHIQNVFRLNIGDKLRVIDGEFEYITEIINIAKKETKLKIIEKNNDIYSLNTNIDIALSVLKNDKMNLAIQKLTELGINKIIPTQTERVVVKINEKKEKWDIVVKESLKQCRGVKFPKIDKLTKLKEIDFNLYDKVIYAYENSEKSEKIYNIVSENDKNILYIVGPEGGITTEEVEFLKNIGAIEISLGKRILRAETAAIVIGGILANICSN